MSHNYLCSLPMSLAHHPSLEVVRLAGNLFTRFPALLDTLPRQTSPTCLLVSLTSYTSVLPRLVHHDLLDLLLLAEAGDGDGGVEAGHQQDTVDNVSLLTLAPMSLYVSLDVTTPGQEATLAAICSR